MRVFQRVDKKEYLRAYLSVVQKDHQMAAKKAAWMVLQMAALRAS